MLVSAIEQLRAETAELLARPELTPEEWQTYTQKRALLFERLYTMDFSALGENTETVAGLIRAILEEETSVHARLESSLDATQPELSSLGTARHALHGYASHRSTSAFTRCA